MIYASLTPFNHAGCAFIDDFDDTPFHIDAWCWYQMKQAVYKHNPYGYKKYQKYKQKTRTELKRA